MSQTIDYFSALNTSTSEAIAIRARRRMFDWWSEYANARRGQTVLDIGATPDQTRPASNCMIPWFEDQGLGVSLYSPEDISGLSKVFPYARILPSAGFGRPIPVPDRAFDWAVASAVIEHVGKASAQIEFLRECARVANGLFITTPNRWHWLEFHTMLPLLHWLPRSIHRRALKALGKGYWANENRLRVLRRSELAVIAASALKNEFTFEIKNVWAFGMPSNLVLLARRRDAPQQQQAPPP